MSVALWFMAGGALLLSMAFASALLARSPLSASMLYLAVGVIASPLALDLVVVTLGTAIVGLTYLAEVVLLLSLFSAGLKMSADLADRRWLPPVRLAVVSMLVTVAAVAMLGMTLLGLSPGAAILLGGILAPTDPVLASDAQLESPADRDQLRYALTGEGGLNDGTAFPVVLLGLSLLAFEARAGTADSDATTGQALIVLLAQWLAFDVLWATVAGIAIGALLGAALGHRVLRGRRARASAASDMQAPSDSFLALGLVAIAYGAALLVSASGFLAVFAAAVALQQVERRGTAKDRPPTIAIPDGRPDGQAAAPMAHKMLTFGEQLDRIGEMVAVVAIGLLLWSIEWRLADAAVVLLLMLVVRPVAVFVGLRGSRTTRVQRALIGWFGIRGVGSLFYLLHAIGQGLTPTLATQLTATALAVITASIMVHGISVTPLMARYRRTHE